MTGSNMYDTAEGVDAYAKMAEGYDGRTHIERLNQLLAPGSTVLELGMGPGVDLDMLAQTYTVVGSDHSQAFLDRYAATHPDADVELLDAITIDTDRRFGAIYSNKILQHLTTDELHRSLQRQAEIVHPDGLLLHGLWAGTAVGDHDGLPDNRYTPDTLAAVVPDTLEIAVCEYYAEMHPNDSLRVILRPSAT